MAALSELDGLSKSFGALRATDNFTLSVDAGEALAVIGLNGAGKSTLFNLITGDLALEPRQGTALAGKGPTAVGHEEPLPAGSRASPIAPRHRRSGLRLVCPRAISVATAPIANRASAGTEWGLVTVTRAGRCWRKRSPRRIWIVFG